MSITQAAPSPREDVAPNPDVRSRESVADRIRSHLATEFLFQDDFPLASDESLLDAGILDSLGVMELVAFLEEEFAITIRDDEMVRANLDTVDALTALVLRHSGEA